MSPERAVPSHDPDMFEDVDAPEEAPPRRPAPEQGASVRVAPERPAAVHAPAEPVRPAPVVAAEAPPAAPAPEDAKGGRLYRSSGATGPLAARAVPALDRHRSPSAGAAAVAYAEPAVPAAPAHAEPEPESHVSGDEAPDWMEEEWPIRPARANPAPVVVVASNPSAAPPSSTAPDWLNPAQAEPQPAIHRPQKANLLGRPTFSKGETRRVGDGLLLARDGVTLVGEWVLVGGAAVIGALIDVIFGGALGLWLPLLTLLAATYGALRIKRSEWLMAMVIPPIALVAAGLVIGQLALPSGHHLFTKEALLMANLLPSVFPWLVVMLLVTGGIAYWRSRTGRGPKIPS